MMNEHGLPVDGVLVLDIPFTQYVMPHGRKRATTFRVSGETASRAKELLDCGYVFECEMLGDYETVSFTVHHEDDDDAEPIAHELCRNGPDVVAATDRLVKAAYAARASLPKEGV